MRSINDQGFSEWLLRVGDGIESVIENDMIKVPPDMGIPWEGEDSLNDLIDRVFLDLSRHMNDLSYMVERAILTLTNEEVDRLNDRIIAKYPGEDHIFYSFDSVDDDLRNLYQQEFLNSISPSGMPHMSCFVVLAETEWGFIIKFWQVMTDPDLPGPSNPFLREHLWDATYNYLMVSRKDLIKWNQRRCVLHAKEEICIFKASWPFVIFLIQPLVEVDVVLYGILLEVPLEHYEVPIASTCEPIRFPGKTNCSPGLGMDPRMLGLMRDFINIKLMRLDRSQRSYNAISAGVLAVVGTGGSSLRRA
ncbi:ATP-dependent DNA helicase PIF1-like [Senna tora]|uniref:ATP-dependent DNA helicase PIF1-like n=1 Tax=Senna tora TaxID=362788 RepID=A0A834SZV4_9FABA|nr:ATP-dependent DNA helicase PIF1-like [Senna tora]